MVSWRVPLWASAVRSLSIRSAAIISSIFGLITLSFGAFDCYCSRIQLQAALVRRVKQRVECPLSLQRLPHILNRRSGIRAIESHGADLLLHDPVLDVRTVD